MKAFPKLNIKIHLQKGVSMKGLYETFKLVKLLTDRSCIRRCYFTTENKRYCTSSTEMYLLKEGT